MCMQIKAERQLNQQDENVEQSAEKGPEWPKAQFRFELVGTLRKSEGAIGASKFSGQTQGKRQAMTLKPSDYLQG